MSCVELSPRSQLSSIVLPATGNISDIATILVYDTYVNSVEFLSGAASQVSEVYYKLGGNILDIELTSANVYIAYENAVLEYSYLMNIHHGKNILSDILGNTTASFDHDGDQSSGPGHVEVLYPKAQFNYIKRINEFAGENAGRGGVGGHETVYSASFSLVHYQQAYDLQTILSASSLAGGVDYAGLVGNKKVQIKRIYYKTPESTWRFFGYYGTLAVLGNMSSYGQYADDSTFEVVPVWQNKLQAMAFEDALYTRYSHYSYEIRNNKLLIYPAPTTFAPDGMWFEFTIQRDSWEEDQDRTTGVNGVANLGTAPFSNIPYENINSIGKHWIRRYATSLCKEMLGLVRSKFATIPIPGENITLNGTELITQAKDEQEKLREEFKTILDELTYAAMAERDAAKVENAEKVNKSIPMVIFKG